MHGDILVEIPDEKLPLLAELYREKATWAPYMHSFIKTAIKWKQSEKYQQLIVVYSPSQTWQQDGTIIAILKLVSQDFIVFTLDDDCDKLYKGLSQTKLISFENRRSLFYGVHQTLLPTVKKFLEEKQVKISAEKPCYIYSIAPENARKFSIDCPSEVYIKKLEPFSAKQINAVWPHSFENSENYLKAFIEQNGGYGAFLRSTNEMVAWVIKHAWGHLALLQTEENFARRGYASLVAKVLSKEIAEEDQWPVGTIVLNNKKSIRMFEKLGFTSLGICSFIIIS